MHQQAIGIQAAEGDKGGVVLITKKTKHVQRPGSNYNKTTFGANKSTRK
jgi:large subunit ribosomal protein L28e